MDAQYALIHESLNEALTDAVRALGGSKKVGAALWPAIPMDEGAGADSLNASAAVALLLYEAVRQRA